VPPAGGDVEADSPDVGKAPSTGKVRGALLIPGLRSTRQPSSSPGLLASVIGKVLPLWRTGYNSDLGPMIGRLKFATP